LADIKLEYAASAALTLSLASLASDANLLAGRESTAISNASNKYLDILLAGKIRAGTTPTVNTTIEVWVYAGLNDAPVYPDVLDGTDSAETLTSLNVKNAALKLAAAITVDATTDRDYFFGPLSIAALFGGSLPKNWGVFVVHNTAVALNATGGEHVISYTPVYATSV